MTLESLLYISESRIAPSDCEDEVKQIVAIARGVNPRIAVTGALIFTGTNFAEVLEGPIDSIATLFASIARDQRHSQISVIARHPVAERRFTDWSMAYSGPSLFISRHVNRLLRDPSASEAGRAAKVLIDLMVEFSRKPSADRVTQQDLHLPL